VRLTENYFIEARKDSPPTVSILKPGRDAKVSPVEEVAVTVQGKDDFALQGLEIHYSVNGQPEKTVSVANAKGRKEADGSTTLYLEDYKLVPGGSFESGAPGWTLSGGARVVSEPRPHSAIASLMYCTSLGWVSRCKSGMYQR